jgi:uncharacterized protein (DUF736 family)
VKSRAGVASNNGGHKTVRLAKEKGGSSNFIALLPVSRSKQSNKIVRCSPPFPFLKATFDRDPARFSQTPSKPLFQRLHQLKEQNMNIGQFKHENGVYTGKVATLTDSLSLRIASTDLQGIDYIVTLEGTKTEVGVAWNRVGEKKGTRYVSVKLDSPFLAAPAYCSLFEQSDGSHNLVWNRPDPKKAKKNDPSAEQSPA